jgi:hypothetical protein
LFILLALIGLVLTAWACYCYVSADASASWAKTEGQVVESRLHVGSGDETSETYWAIVVYEYSVDGVEYSSDRISFGLSRNSSGGEEETRSAVKRYPKGSTVTVYYDPEDPASATLERQVSPTAHYVLLAGLAFLGSGPFIKWLEKYQNA